LWLPETLCDPDVGHKAGGGPEDESEMELKEKQSCFVTVCPWGGITPHRRSASGEVRQARR